jgi:hypothetical protein
LISPTGNLPMPHLLTISSLSNLHTYILIKAGVIQSDRCIDASLFPL